MTWQLSVAGALVGVLVGMKGMGGGSLMTPVVIVIFGFDPTPAATTRALDGSVFKSFGSCGQRVVGSVRARLACGLRPSSAPVSLIGGQVAESLGEGPDWRLQQSVSSA